jgi:hypothetical protein
MVEYPGYTGAGRAEGAQSPGHFRSIWFRHTLTRYSVSHGSDNSLANGNEVLRMPSQTSDVTVDFTVDDMRRLRDAAKACRLTLEEFVRLTVVGSMCGLRETSDRA